jgi:hypothetical protein
MSKTRIRNTEPGLGRLYVCPEPLMHPWDRVNLLKSERKGKTYLEMQEMRRERWEEARKTARKVPE